MLAAIQAIRNNAESLIIRLTFDPNTFIQADATESRYPDPFYSIAILGLVLVADQVFDSAGTEIKAPLSKTLWEDIILSNDGLIGDGKKQSIVCRFPGTSVPRCLRESSEIRIPSRIQFDTLLRSIFIAMGATMSNASQRRLLDSVAERELSSILFEAFRNAIEHNDESITLGIWGIIIEKVIITPNDIISLRKQIPHILQDYVDREIAREDQKRSHALISVTIADYGPGIQNTLPQEGNETNVARLIRAFDRGVSRKPKSGSPDWGQGLPNIVESAKALNALLFVRSDQESLLLDGGTVQPTWIRTSASYATNKQIAGTSLTATWIVRQKNPDQGYFEFPEHD